MKTKFLQAHFLSKSEKKLLDDIKVANEDSSTLWKIPNLAIPFVAIGFAFLSLMFFRNKELSPLDFFNILVGGSLPLIALNQISSAGLHLFHFDKKREKELGLKETEAIRIKLHFFSLIIFGLAVLFYAFQVISVPYDDYFLASILLLISILLIGISTRLTLKIYLLQGQFLEKTFNQELRDEGNSKHGLDWDHE